MKQILRVGGERERGRKHKTLQPVKCVRSEITSQQASDLELCPPEGNSITSEPRLIMERSTYGFFRANLNRLIPVFSV